MRYEEKLVVPAIKFRTFLDKFPNFHNVYIICSISCVSGMMFGFDISSMSAFLGGSDTPYLKYFNHPNATIQGFITSCMPLGSFFGSIASTFISEPFGRRASLLICALLWMVGAAIQSSAQNRAQLMIGRIISGVGVGFGSSVAPVYGSELAPRKIRGTIGGIFQFSVTLGIMIFYYICYGLFFVKGVASFRIAWAIQIVPGLILFCGCFFIPESPRWLAKNGYWDDAEQIVANVQANGDRRNSDVLIEISEIKDQILIDENIKAFTYADLFRKKYLYRTFTAIFAQIWQQLTGMNVMMYYIAYIFEMAGYGGNANLVASSIQYVLNTVMTIPALFLLDIIGRRTMLIVGAISMMTWQFAVAGILATYSESIPNLTPGATVTITISDLNKPAAKAVIACCYLFVCSFASTWGVGIWVYCSEVWGDSASRQRGAAVSTAANWILNFAIAMYSPSSFKNLAWRVYIIYGCMCFAMGIHVYFGFPETKGKRLEEIGQMWDEGIPAWRSGSWQPTLPLLSDAQCASKMEIYHRENTSPKDEFNTSEADA